VKLLVLLGFLYCPQSKQPMAKALRAVGTFKLSVGKGFEYALSYKPAKHYLYKRFTSTNYMIISYQWLCEYLPVPIPPTALSNILTSLGLEVEALTTYESIKGGLKGLVVGEVIACTQHPNADKLIITEVNIGTGSPVQIVCGASNVAVGQKVVVATVGCTIYPTNKKEGTTIKAVTIRSVASQGMICAEDEIGLGNRHVGIMILPNDVPIGTLASDYFLPYTDFIFEIGLTPNRMDAMSHWGVAKDVCAYLSHHEKKTITPIWPTLKNEPLNTPHLPIQVSIENKEACGRYCGVGIEDITVMDSPKWLQDRLKAIGVNPINNVVDSTNYILHETGQPLHAFDYDTIKNHHLFVKNVAEGTPFVTLDGKEKKLSKEDLMICDANHPLCIAGVYGGLTSGVTPATKNIFIEVAWFEPTTIRKTSFKHGLRTDAATRFEKNVDISNVPTVLQRAALLIQSIAGGSIASEMVDIYPHQQAKKQVSLSYAYLQKLSGKYYPPATVQSIVTSLGFDVIENNENNLLLAAPYSKPDIALPADVVEEIMRIDGYDNIAIPTQIVITASENKNGFQQAVKEKIATLLVGAGFNEILTNSIANKAWYSEDQLAEAVLMLNSLSADLNVMRLSMLETGLASIAHNLNRKNHHLRFFEFGKIYLKKTAGQYQEQEQLCLFITGKTTEQSWKQKAVNSDLFYIKGVVQNILQWLGLPNLRFNAIQSHTLQPALAITYNNMAVATLGEVAPKTASLFDIKQPVWYAQFNWENISSLVKKVPVKAAEVPKFLPVQRDLSLVVPKATTYTQLEEAVQTLALKKLQQVHLFDVFESDTLGVGKKSMAVNFNFLDTEKTFTDKEIDAMMQKIMVKMEEALGATVRK
jgi:phenylalanyl-tRNA synthetase beta chain